MSAIARLSGERVCEMTGDQCALGCGRSMPCKIEHADQIKVGKRDLNGIVVRFKLRGASTGLRVIRRTGLDRACALLAARIEHPKKFSLTIAELRRRLAFVDGFNAD